MEIKRTMKNYKKKCISIILGFLVFAMGIALFCGIKKALKKLDCDAKNGISALSYSILKDPVIGIDDLSFDHFWFTFKHDAKGVIVVYSVKEKNGWWSCAYYIPFGTEPYMLLK